MKGKFILATSLLLALTGCGHKPERAAPSPLPTATVRAQAIESKKRVATEEVVGTVWRRRPPGKGARCSRIC